MHNIINEKPSENLSGRLLTSVNFVDLNDINNKIILDIGCGYGWFELFALKNNVKFAYACDLTDADLVTIKTNVNAANLDIRSASAIDLPYEKDLFDTVVCWEVIEHIPKHTESKLFAEAARVLKPGGVLYLSTPYASLPSKVFDPAWWFIGHRHYTEQQLIKFAEKNNLVYIDHKIYGKHWVIIDILNMYISKWIFRRPRFLSKGFNLKSDFEYAVPNGYVNIFIKFKKQQ